MMTRFGEVARCVGVRDGVVVAIEPLESELTGTQTVQLAEDEVLLPGLVDTHVHVNEPGRTEWEGFATATRAAAAGGVTTIVDMPLNSVPPTVSADALRVKQAAAAELVAALATVDALFVVHAEDPERLLPVPSSAAYRDFLASRPPESEAAAVATAIDAARATGGRVHILHLSAAEALPVVA